MVRAGGVPLCKVGAYTGAFWVCAGVGLFHCRGGEEVPCVVVRHGDVAGA